MKAQLPRCVEEGRVRTGEWGSSPRESWGGSFVKLKSGALAKIVFSDGLGWEHVSVSLEDRCRPRAWSGR